MKIIEDSLRDKWDMLLTGIVSYMPPSQRRKMLKNFADYILNEYLPAREETDWGNEINLYDGSKE